MIIRNVLEIQVPSDDAASMQYTAVYLDTPATIHEDENEELIPGVVYIPVDACIYFIDATTVKVEI